MNEIIKLGVDFLRRLVPTPAAVRRTWIGAKRERRMTEMIFIVCLLLPILVGIALLLYKRVNSDKDVLIEARFLVLLPDHYPEAAFTLQQRAPAIEAWALEALAQRLPPARTQLAGVAPVLQARATPDGRFTLALRDASPSNRNPSRPALAHEVRAQYIEVLRAAGEAVSKQLPVGSRVAVLGVEASQQARGAPTPQALMYFIGVPYGLAVLMIYLLMRHNLVVDKALAQSVFPGVTRMLQVPYYPDWRDRLREGRTPPEVHLLAEFLVAEYQAGRRSVAIVSSLPREGKSTITLMLWQALRLRLPLRLVDADRRADLLRLLEASHFAASSPQVHALFADGPTRTSNAPTTLPAPASSEVMSLVDCTPLFWAREEIVLLKQVDLVLLVIEETGGRRGIERVAEQLSFLGVIPAGLVLNKVSEDPTLGIYGLGY
jgi:hypothetical protein